MIRGVVVACMLSACGQEVEPGGAKAAGTSAAAPMTPSSAVARVSGATVDEVPQPVVQRLRRALSRSPENLRFERRGARLHVDMAGTFQTATVVVPNERGETQRVCLEDAAELDRMLGVER